MGKPKFKFKASIVKRRNGTFVLTVCDGGRRTRRVYKRAAEARDALIRTCSPVKREGRQ